MKLNTSGYILAILAVLLQTTFAIAQKEVWIGPAKEDSPKTVTVRILPNANSRSMIDKLADSTAVLQRRAKEYVSTPIKFKVSEGACSIEQVVPGKYSLELPALDFDTSIQIPRTTENDVTLIVRLKKDGISAKVLLAKQ
jgi:hypothetical protein